MTNTRVPTRPEIEHTLASVRESLPSHSSVDEIMASLNRVVESDPVLAMEMMQSILSLPRGINGIWRLVLGDRFDDRGRSYEWYRKMFLLLPITELIFDGDFSGYLPPGYAWSILQKYADVSEKYVGYKPDGTNGHLLQAALVVLHVTDSKGNKLPEYRNELFFVAENIDRLKPLLHIVKQRKNVSIPFLQELLNGASSSLGSGIL